MTIGGGHKGIRQEGEQAKKDEVIRGSREWLRGRILVFFRVSYMGFMS
jgi:hypothetical protein